jgi:hypothetical protein
VCRGQGSRGGLGHRPAGQAGQPQIADIDPEAWTTIAYPRAVFDEQAGQWISVAEVAEIELTAFTSKKEPDQITGRLAGRRVPALKTPPGQGTLSSSAPPRVLHHHPTP